MSSLSSINNFHDTSSISKDSDPFKANATTTPGCIPASRKALSSQPTLTLTANRVAHTFDPGLIKKLIQSAGANDVDAQEAFKYFCLQYNLELSGEVRTFDQLTESQLKKLYTNITKTHQCEPSYLLESKILQNAISKNFIASYKQIEQTNVNSRDLNLSNQALKLLPSNISKLTNLTKLNLCNTQISDIRALSGLTNLTTLGLSNTQISDIKALSGLTNLTKLILCNNQISDISALSGLTNLTRLNLSNTQISDIRALSKLTNLDELSLSSNQISDIRALSGLTKLTILGLSDNPIYDIGALSKLANLTTLGLSNTQISDIDALSELSNLISLGLDNTPISDIGASKLANLTGFSVYNTQVSDTRVLRELTNLDSVD